MSTYTDLVDKAGDQVVSAMRQAQEVAVSAVSTVSDAVGIYLPELPKLPLSGRIPAPAEVVESTFSVAGRLLETQKDYTLALIQALEPITAKFVPAATPEAPGARKAKSTGKASAKKA